MREPNWYYADKTGAVFNVSNILISSLLETQYIYQYRDAPGGFRQSIPTFKSSVNTSTFELRASSDADWDRLKTEDVLRRVDFNSEFVGWSTYRCYNNRIPFYWLGQAYYQHSASYNLNRSVTPLQL